MGARNEPSILGQRLYGGKNYSEEVAKENRRRNNQNKNNSKAAEETLKHKDVLDDIANIGRKRNH